MLSNIALAMAALAHLGLTSAEVFMIEAIGFAGAGWSVSGNGCNTPRSSSVQCEPVEYEDINAQVGDILVFTYQQFHNVFQHETAAKAEACDFNGGTLVGRENVGSVYDRDLRITGFQYKLTEAGDFGFSCARSGNNPAWKTIGQHCNHGQRVTVHVAPPGAFMEIDWIIKPYDDMTAVVGDTINFKYNSYHDVYLHPSGSCDRAGAVLIGDNADGDATRGGASHQFTEPGSYTFACQMASHCDSGQIVTVIVTAGGSCTGDVTGDGVVGVGDVLQVLSAFGSSSFTTEDINGDGVVNVGDILATLGAFGSSCAAQEPAEPCAAADVKLNELNTLHADFGPATIDALQTTDLAFKYADNLDEDMDCPPPAGDYTGKVALMWRAPPSSYDYGSCSFRQKVLGAQGKGAVAVVIIDRDDRHKPLDAAMSGDMGGGDESPTIPAFAITQAEGEVLIATPEAAVSFWC